MKKLLIYLIVMFSFSISSNAQNASRKKLMCVTSSCCGWDLLGINVDIYSATNCYYLSKNSNQEEDLVTIKFETDKPLKSITVKDDIAIAGLLDKDGKGLILSKGDYNLKDNLLEFTPARRLPIKLYCITGESSGTILGHEFSYSTTVCGYFWGKNTANVSITPEFNNEQLEQLAKNNYMITLNKDIQLTKDKDGVSSVVKAGNYKASEDGTINIQNILVN